MDELVEEKLKYLKKTINGIEKEVKKLEETRYTRPTYLMLENLNSATTYLENILTSLRMQVERAEGYADAKVTKEEERKREDTMFR
jgi:hypothetical protein